MGRIKLYYTRLSLKLINMNKKPEQEERIIGVDI